MKQLDAREEFLDNREKILDEDTTESGNKLEVLQKQIDAKMTVIASLDDKSGALDIQLQDVIRQRDNVLADLEREKAALQKQLKLAETTQDSLRATASNLRKENEAIQQQIRESKQYFKVQEASVTEAIAEWNAQLTGFQQEAINIEDQKNKALEQIVRIEQDKVSMGHEIEALQSKFDDLDTAYQAKAKGYREDLKVLSTQVYDKRKEISEIEPLQQAKVKGIQAKEREMKIKEIALSDKEQSLSAKERRLRGDYNRNGLAFDS